LYRRSLHLFNHEGLPEAEAESHAAHMREHTRWEPSFTAQVIRQAERRGIVLRENGHLSLTEQGRQLAHTAIAN
jgi:manganese/zinc/iron transport system permease protein